MLQYLSKLNRLDRVVEEVRLVLKPHYAKKHITKEDYKDILRRAVPKVRSHIVGRIVSVRIYTMDFAPQINHNRTGEINPVKIKALIEAYVRKFRAQRRKHPQHQHLNLSGE